MTVLTLLMAAAAPLVAILEWPRLLAVFPQGSIWPAVIAVPCGVLGPIIFGNLAVRILKATLALQTGRSSQPQILAPPNRVNALMMTGGSILIVGIGIEGIVAGVGLQAAPWGSLSIALAGLYCFGLGICGTRWAWSGNEKKQ